MRLVVGVTGASGSVYAVRLLEVLRELGWESHLVLTAAAMKTLGIETDLSPRQLQDLASFTHDNDDLTAPLASGSFRTDGMVVVPCSVGSLSAIANSFDHNLLVRAADVTLKERRRLVLVVRETPLHLGHLRLMARVTEQGAIVLPPVPGFYQRPTTLAQVVDHTVGKILDLFGAPVELFPRWGGKG